MALGRSTMVLVGTFLASLSMLAERPTLLVGIVIEGLRQETLDQLRPYFQKNGFNRFFENGVVMDNVDFGTALDAPSAAAVLVSGAPPGLNGIASERIYEPDGRRTVHAFKDDGATGSYTDEKLSPSALKVSTLTDEARIAGAGVTYAHTIAPNAAMALVLGSHAGNSAIWFNDKTGDWATTAYYRDTPAAAINSNRTHSLLNRLDTMQWKPASVTALASGLPDHLVRYPFRYTFTNKDSERFVRYAGSPMINADITALATNYITTLDLGKHDGLDVLNLGFSLLPYEFTKTAESRYELYDSYIKLDKSLSDLFTYIDDRIGRDRVVFYISGTPSPVLRRKDESKWNIPSGEFSSRKAMSLLNLYLIAIHGNGDWVSGFHNGHFYLNRELIKNKEKDLSAMRRQVAEFLVRMSGVGHAYTIEDIVNANASVPNAQGQSRNTVVLQAGDVVVDLIPGWSLLDDFNNVKNSETKVVTYAPATASFLLSAPNVTAQRIDSPVDARSIAPTVAKVLHIRSPNGAMIPGLNLK